MKKVESFEINMEDLRYMIDRAIDDTGLTDSERPPETAKIKVVTANVACLNNEDTKLVVEWESEV